MNNLTFNFNGNSITVVVKNGEPWFIGSEVCSILEVKNTGDAYSRLKDYEKSTVVITDGTSGNPNKAIISESGLYRLVLTSRKPQAEAFQDWVVQEVLPSIRKTGSYSINKPISEDDYMEHLIKEFNLPRNYVEALKQLVVKEEERLVLKESLTKAEEVLDVYRAITSDKASISFKQVADALAIKNMGRNNLIKFLRSENFLVKSGQVVPCRPHIEADRAIVYTSTYQYMNEDHTKQTTRLTFKGLAWVLNRLRVRGYSVNKSARAIWDSYNPTTNFIDNEDEELLVETARASLMANC
jgi:anti-repressor protein